MCTTGTGAYIPARSYLPEAKRRAAHLKPLRSVSRAYRLSEVHFVKVTAKENTDVSRTCAQEAARRALAASDPRWDGGADAFTVFPGGSVIANQYQAYLSARNAYGQGNTYLSLTQQAGGLLVDSGVGKNLAAFQTIPPPKPLPVEIKAGELVAWRCWSQSNGRLRSVSMGCVWEPGQPMVGEVAAHGPAGVHAWKTCQQAKDYFSCSADAVVGSVELWGEVIEHANGYRAQYAAIRSLDWACAGSKTLPALRETYGVEPRTHNDFDDATVPAQIPSIAAYVMAGMVVVLALAWGADYFK